MGHELFRVGVVERAAEAEQRVHEEQHVDREVGRNLLKMSDAGGAVMDTGVRLQL